MQASVYCVLLRKQELPGMHVICVESQVATLSWWVRRREIFITGLNLWFNGKFLMFGSQVSRWIKPLFLHPECQGPCLWKDGPLTGNPSPGVEGVTPLWWRMMGKINGEQHTEGPLMSSVQRERVQSHLTSDLNPAHVFVCIHACILRVKAPSVLNSLILCFIYFEKWWRKCGSATPPVKLPKLLPPLWTT